MRDFGEVLDLHSDDRRSERRTLRERLMAWVSIAGLVVALGMVLWASDVWAGEVFRSTGADGKPMSLRLFDEPCTDQKVQAALKIRVQPKYIPLFKRAALVYGGANWQSCWLEVGGMVLSIDEAGDFMMGIPRQAFRDEAI